MSFFTISNDVQQAGILSPELFAIYMDDHSNLLIGNGIGCHSTCNNICGNHLFYVDDLGFMVP